MCVLASACGDTNQAAPAAVLSIPSPAAYPPAGMTAAAPTYGLVNDTSKPVGVTGCGPACPRTHLAPDAELDFSIAQGQIRVQLADGMMNCLQFLNGAALWPPPPRQILRISKFAFAAPC